MAKLAFRLLTGSGGEGELEASESHKNTLCLITYHIQKETRCQYCHTYLARIYTEKYQLLLLTEGTCRLARYWLSALVATVYF